MPINPFVDVIVDGLFNYEWSLSGSVYSSVDSKVRKQRRKVGRPDTRVFVKKSPSVSLGRS